MKQAIIATLLLFSGFPASADRAWDFASAGSALGWTTNADISRCQPGPKGLVCETRGGDPVFTLGGLSIPASNRQFLEIELETGRQEDWRVFWANSTEGRYGGFEQEKSDAFKALPGGFRKYRLYPFWQQEGRIVQLRLDPPDGGGSKFTLKAIRLLETPAAAAASRPAWSFNATDNGWSPATNVTVTSRQSSGWRLTTTGAKPLLLSPPLRVPADNHLWASVTLTASAGDTCLLYWATDRKPGLQSASFKLKPDGQSHVYNLDMGADENWGGSIVALGFGPPGDSGAVCTLKSLSLGSSRGGGPELNIAALALADPMVRAGKSTKIEARLTNTGGAPTGPVKLRLARPATISVSGALEAEIPALSPGEEAVHSWTASSSTAVSETLRVQAAASGAAAASANATVRWQPALPAGTPASASYVPAPKPAPTGDYTVGCYYFPGWHTYERWSVLNGFPERKPLLGYYREGNPEVADWHVKWALEHGISFFAFDWYWSAGGRSLEHALHDGFLKSRYFSQMKFCLLWANHNPPKTSSMADMEAVTRYWIDNYFKRPEYLKLNGRPVVIIFSPARFTDDMGIEGTRKALERSRELCRQAGAGSAYFIACTYPQQAAIKVLEQEGYDALTGYNYPSAGDRGNLVAPYADNITGYQEFWDSIYRASTVPYIPVTDPGWDSRPWHGHSARVRTGKHPDMFAKMLRNAKAFVDTPGRRLPQGKKIVLAEAWNEFGEGDFIEPTAEFGFGYLDAVRDVFSTAPREHADLVPSDVGLGPYQIEPAKPSSAFEFNSAARAPTSQNMKDVAVRDGALVGTSLNNDPAFYIDVGSLDASKLRCIELRLKVSAGKEAQLFWTHAGAGFVEPRSTRFLLTPGDQYRVYRINLSAAPRWSGKVRSIRLDMTDAAGASVALDYVRFLESCP